MPDEPPTNILPFQRTTPSVNLRRPEEGSKRLTCKHVNVDVWMGEPLLECKDCGASVDPYDWIRYLVMEWENYFRDKNVRKAQMEREIADLERRIRALRGEYNDAAEQRAAERSIAVLPPQRGQRWRGDTP